MAIAITVSQGCEDCIFYHVDAAKKRGADGLVLIEVLKVAIEMGGGPAVIYAGKARNAYCDL